MKLNVGKIPSKAKNLLQEELKKNKEIHCYGEALEGIDHDIKELELRDQDINTQALTKMIKYK